MAPELTLPPRYEPIASLGRGGGGEVWKVVDRITGRTVALKALGEQADERQVLALVREAVALSGVEGLGVPRVLRFGRLPRSERSYMVRELVHGESLADLIASGAEPRGLLAAIADAADQLTRLHRALLLHGDLKPANIIVGDDGRATLVDLGLATRWREGGGTPEGLTPRYAAPELFQGEPLTVRAEVFALGASIAEITAAGASRLGASVMAALGAVIDRAISDDPAARYPSADELASALRRAAQLGDAPEVPSERGGAGRGDAVWPVLGLDGATARLMSQIAALPEGGGLVITGPRLSGRTALLRRIAWSLGVEGRKVAWIEAADLQRPREAIEIELAAYERERGVVVLVDDAERLGELDLARLDEVRQAGGKLCLVVGAKGPPARLPGETFGVWSMAPLEEAAANELVRRAIPSLGDVVVSHVVARAERWPGRIRAIVAQLSRAPVVSPADVDRILEEELQPATERGSSASEIHRLLDRGHFEEAAEWLDRASADRSPAMAIARARLYTNRGDAARALAELAIVEREVAASADPLLRAGWDLHTARAHLRAGDYPEAERFAVRAEHAATEVTTREATLRGEGEGVCDATDRAARTIATEALTITGLGQSLEARHDEAKATLETSVRLARDLGEPRTVSLALSSLAFALQRDDHLSEAESAYAEALLSAEQAGDAGSVATIRLNLATIAKTRGDLASALRHLDSAVDMGRRSGRTATVRQALLNLANLDLYLGRHARARVSLDALDAQRGDLPPQLHAQLLALEAEHAARIGDSAAADRLCAECASAYEAMGRHLDAAEARLERVLFAASTPGADAAALAEEIAQAERALGTTTAHRGLLTLARGRTRELANDEEGARAAYDEALEAARAAGQRDLQWRALEARATLELSAGQSLRAKRDREAALSILEEIAERLPRDLREVFWNDARRRAMRSSILLELGTGATVNVAAATGAPQLSQDRLARVLEINREIAGEYDLTRLLERVTDHAIALLRAERGFVILRAAGPRRDSLGPGDRPASPGSRGAEGAAPVATLPEAEAWSSRRRAPDAEPSDLFIHASRDQAGDDPHARFSRSIAEKVIKTGEPVVTSSAREDARMAGYVSVHQLMIQAVACVPIRSRGGDAIGALYLETRLRAGVTFAEELPTLVALADQVAIAIATARLVGENERRARDLAQANEELEGARKKLEEMLGHRTAQLAATRRSLKTARMVLRSHFGYEGLVGTSEAMRRVYALIDRVKDTDVPVLITGESGTGKEIIARALHNAGPRSKKSFVGINCGAIPEHLLESELFGHVRGAFTGADRDRKGLFREATEGTVLLDEIGEMPQKMQAGLLRVLQEKVMRPVGATREEPVDTRVVAATHRDLSRMVQEGTFREDLYYRLHVIEVRVPPLRERLDDIPILIDHFLGIFAARYGRERRAVSRSALKRLGAYGWPGNVRQLENVLLNAWVLSDRPELEVDDFELPDSTSRAPARGSPAPLGRSVTPPARERVTDEVESSLDAHKAGERERILKALSGCNWNRVKAAQVVGLPRRTFYRRLKEYGIQ